MPAHVCFPHTPFSTPIAPPDTHCPAPRVLPWPSGTPSQQHQHLQVSPRNRPRHSAPQQACHQVLNRLLLMMDTCFHTWLLRDNHYFASPSTGAKNDHLEASLLNQRWGPLLIPKATALRGSRVPHSFHETAAGQGLGASLQPVGPERRDPRGHRPTAEPRGRDALPRPPARPTHHWSDCPTRSCNSRSGRNPHPGNTPRCWAKERPRKPWPRPSKRYAARPQTAATPQCTAPPRRPQPGPRPSPSALTPPAPS